MKVEPNRGWIIAKYLARRIMKSMIGMCGYNPTFIYAIGLYVGAGEQLSAEVMIITKIQSIFYVILKS